YVGMYVRQVWLARTRVSGRSVTQNATAASPPEFQADVTAVAADVVGRTSGDLYREAMHLVLPFLQGHALRLDPECFGRGLALLEHVVRMEPTEWRPLWALGMSYRRTESHVRSYECLARAYELAPNESPTVVEYVRACLWLGRTQEALMPAKHQVEL